MQTLKHTCLKGEIRLKKRLTMGQCSRSVSCSREHDDNTVEVHIF